MTNSALTFKEKSIEVIRKNVENSIKQCGDRVNVETANRGAAISVREQGYSIWIRLYPLPNGKYIADISSIEFPENRRRCGMLDIMFKRLRGCKYIEEVRITSVCTQEMFNWCNKHKLTDIGYNCYSSKK